VTLTGFGASKGNGVAAYVAPEVANGIEGGPQADVFSLAATLYAAVEGRPPWGDGGPEQTRSAAMKGIVEPPRQAGALAPVLIRPEPLDRFGKTILDPSAGNFDRCDVYIEAGDDRAAARVQLAQSGPDLPDGVPEDHDGMVVVRGAPVEGECIRTLRLSDGYD